MSIGDDASCENRVGEVINLASARRELQTETNTQDQELTSAEQPPHVAELLVGYDLRLALSCGLVRIVLLRCRLVGVKHSDLSGKSRQIEEEAM